MLLATQSQSPSLTSMKQQPNGEYIFHFVFLVCFCSMWFVAGVGQVYFILSLFNSVPANNYSFTIESENWWKSAITAIYNNKTFLQLGKAYFTVLYICFNSFQFFCTSCKIDDIHVWCWSLLTFTFCYKSYRIRSWLLFHFGLDTLSLKNTFTVSIIPSRKSNWKLL